MEHWIYLQLLLDYGCINTGRIIENIKDISKLHEMSAPELLAIGVPKHRVENRKSVTLQKAREILNQCQQNKIFVIPYCDSKYPQKLKAMANPPVVLYAVGTIPDFDSRLSVAVVGTREISDYGSRAAFSLAARLALGGALVVSGGAVGGDFYAHNGAIAVGEPTVNVTGGGLLSGYLKKNKTLRKDIILGGGLLITEFIPDYVPKNKNSFHLRNRIIAGLSDGVAVIEAKAKSGTLITAHIALELGKEVFAISGDKDDPQYDGCRSLIFDGAYTLNSPKDILSMFDNYKVDYQRMDSISNSQLKEMYQEFLARQKAIEESIAKKKSQRKSNKPVSKEKQPKTAPRKPIPAPQGLDPNCKAVYEAVKGEEIFADEIVIKTNLNAGTVLTTLTMLEVKGLVEAMPGGRYRLVDKEK